MSSGHIDVHAHALTESYVATWRGLGMDRPDGIAAWPTWSPGSAIETMDRLGIAAAVLSISSPGVFLGDAAATARLASQQNDELSALTLEHPDRFGFAACLPLPDVGAAVAELERVAALPGCDAISLLTNVDGRYLGDPDLEPLMADLDERGAVVIVHPSAPACWEATSLGRPRPLMEFLFDSTRAVGNLLFNGVLTRYRSIRWVIPHSGGVTSVLADRFFAFTVGGVLEGVEADLDVFGELSRLYYDTAGVAFPRALPTLVDLVGTERILYGSDYPFTPPLGVELGLGALAANPLSEVSNDELLRRNTASLFPRLAAG